MIGQDHHRVDFKWKPLPRLAHSIAKAVDVLDQQAAVAVEQIDREEIRATWDEYATIVWQLSEYAERVARRNTPEVGYCALRPSARRLLVAHYCWT